MAQAGCHIPAAPGSRVPARGPGAGGDRRRAEPGPGPLDVLLVRPTGAGDPRRRRARVARPPRRARRGHRSRSRARRSAPRSSRPCSIAGRRVIVTTHLEPLKVFAQVEPRLQNATVAFDAERLEPTFRLEYGHPGPSHALTIGAAARPACRGHRRAPGRTSAKRPPAGGAPGHAGGADRARPRARARSAARREAEAARRLRPPGSRPSAPGRGARDPARGGDAGPGAPGRRPARRSDEELDRLKTDAARGRRAAQEAYRRLRAAEATLQPVAGRAERRARPAGRGPAPAHLGLRGRVVAESGGLVTVQAGSLTVRVRAERDRARRGRPGRAPGGRRVGPGPGGRGARAPPARPHVRRGARGRREVPRRRGAGRTPGNPLVHGKGTGALRRAVEGVLRGHPLVGQFRLAEPAAGGAGVTVVALEGGASRGARAGAAGAVRPEGEPMRVPPEVLDEIRARVDLVDLVGAVVPLKRAGERLEGPLPVPQERTPSFTVHPKLGHLPLLRLPRGRRCLQFLRRHDRLDFPEAVRLLAERAGVRLPGRESTPEGGRRATGSGGSWSGPRAASSRGSGRRGGGAGARVPRRARDRGARSRAPSGSAMRPRAGTICSAPHAGEGIRSTSRSSGPGSCSPGRRARPLRPLPRAAHLPDRGHAGPRHRLRGPGAGRRGAEVPQLPRDAALPEGTDAVRPHRARERMTESAAGPPGRRLRRLPDGAPARLPGGRGRPRDRASRPPQLGLLRRYADEAIALLRRRPARARSGAARRGAARAIGRPAVVGADPALGRRSRAGGFRLRVACSRPATIPTPLAGRRPRGLRARLPRRPAAAVFVLDRALAEEDPAARAAAPPRMRAVALMLSKVQMPRKRSSSAREAGRRLGVDPSELWIEAQQLVEAARAAAPAGRDRGPRRRGAPGRAQLPSATCCLLFQRRRRGRSSCRPRRRGRGASRAPPAPHGAAARARVRRRRP